MTVFCNTKISELDGLEPFEDSDRRAGRVCAGRDADRGDKYQDQAGPTLTRVD